MSQERYRYYMEVRTDSSLESQAAAHKNTQRRQRALSFIQSFKNWLQENSLDAKVDRLDVTPMGYVHITCARDIIDRVRDTNELNITTIRQAAPLDQLAKRFSA